VKNIAFLMNRRGEWRLSPAFDVSYAWNPQGEWTSQHQMSLNGKRDGFERSDLLALAASAGIKKARARTMLDGVIEAVRRWPEFADRAGVEERRIGSIRSAQRVDL
jgi:serine/threonine-protein kinase HipA